MAVAQLVGDQRLELGLVGREHGLGEVGDRVGDGGGVGRLGKRGCMCEDVTHRTPTTRRQRYDDG